jgi:cytochrome P450
VSASAGDKVVVSFIAANRDPAVFDRPSTFDITRKPNPHLAFSEGTHLCLGRNIARVELEVLITKFLAQFPHTSEVAPRATWNDGNNFISSLKSLPVSLAGAVEAGSPAYAG